MPESWGGSYRVLSLMAGSSADGVTAALVQLTRRGPHWSYALLTARNFPYPDSLRQQLLSAATLTAQPLLRLSITYTDWTAQQVQVGFAGRVYDILSWHPHNVFHEAEQGLTWSLGDSERLRVLVGKPVVSHFRARDIASGGTGAPLIPNADQELFASYETLLNLGGIANLTHLPTPLAYDICPCNQLLNALAHAYNPQLLYDPAGSLARAGQYVPALAEIFQSHPFLQLLPPKALSNAVVQEGFVQPFLEHPAPLPDKLHTATRCIVRSLIQALQQVGAKHFTLTGGGTHNSFLHRLLLQKAEEAGLTYISAPLSLVEYREAIGFAFLGLLRWLAERNTHPQWTGARRAHSSGSLSL